jgi:hypothetical protein
MKTVGIFSDSHADCTYLEWKSRYKTIGLGWPELLALKYKVKNFAMGGSGMFYSYNLFKKMHSKFDIIIYVPTQASRFSAYYPDTKQTVHLVPGFLLSTAKTHLAGTFNNVNDRKVVEAAIAYSTYLLDTDKDNEMKRLMLEEVKRLRPDTIFIPAFQDDVVSPKYVNISHISAMELSAFDISFEKLRKLDTPLMDIRKCHLTDDNNRMLFNKVMAAIDNRDTNVRITESDFVKPMDPFTKYFVDDNGRTNI